MAEFEQLLTKEEREALLLERKKEIESILATVDGSLLDLHKGLIEEAATYSATLHEMNLIMTRDGIVDFYKNGANQYGTKESVSAKLKPKYTATYQSLIKQLCDLLPTKEEADAAKELMAFING